MPNLDGTGQRDVLRIAPAMAANGLTQADIDEGWDLLKSTSRVRGSRQAEYTASPTVVANRHPAEEINAAIEEAETDLWAWYLDWLRLARVAVKDGRLRARLGLAGRGRGGKAEEEDVEPAPVPGAPGLARRSDGLRRTQ